MKLRHNRVRASVLTVAIISAAGWATAQQVNNSNAHGDAGVRGSGTPNTIPLWTGKDTLGNSSITQSDNGDQTINGSLGVTGSLFLPNTSGPNTGVIFIGGTPVLYTVIPSSCPPINPQCGRNIFVGPSAGNFTTTGGDNTATGDEALDSITTGFLNTATGSHALFANTTGTGNTATGWQALFSNTSGGDNTATGWQALFSNTTGVSNTAMGPDALWVNTTGSENTAIGILALGANTTGTENTAMGAFALSENTTGKFNTAVGKGALALGSGNDNTAIGFNASLISSGNNNTAIGFGAGVSIGSGSNNIDIGANVFGAALDSNTVRIGNANNRGTFLAGIYGVPTGLPGAAVVVDANGQLGTVSSSRRFKDDIEDMGDASSDLMKLRPVTFRYKQAQEDGSHPLQYGLVAEEVAEVNPGLVQFDKDGQPQTVLYHVLPSLLLNEVQKEHQKIEDQQKLIQAQQEQLKVQDERLRKLETILSSTTN
jgi:hypothetical protein